VVSTGSELVPADREPGPGQVWDANGPALEAAVRAAGARVGLRVSVPDDPEILRVTLERAAALCDLVLTTGGVSQGAYEVVKDALPEVTLRAVAMQRGRAGSGTRPAPRWRPRSAPPAPASGCA